MRVRQIVLYLVVSSFTAFAQSDRGTITGTISDPAGAVVASAVVEAKNADTGTVYQAGSSATGNFTLAQMPTGTRMDVGVAAGSADEGELGGDVGWRPGGLALVGSAA